MRAIPVWQEEYTKTDVPATEAAGTESTAGGA